MEMTLIISALGIGFASGFHCVGMCGPIALSMGLTKNQALNFHLQNLTYNFGRIVTYIFLGAILGLVGEGFQMAGVQEYLTIAAGILLIIMALFSFGGKDIATKIPFLSNLLLKIKMALSKILQKPDYKSRFFTGILNGFLPCGMLYIALTASLAAGGSLGGAFFMFLFGLGTLPFMFAVVFAGSLMNQTFRQRILKVVPIMMIVLGGLFIVRGMGLGIPYLSPKKEVLQVKHNHSVQDGEDEHSSCH